VVQEIEDFFQNIKIPTGVIKINAYPAIPDYNAFICSHLAVVKPNNGNRTFAPHI
jgi:hypothetical protein